MMNLRTSDRVACSLILDASSSNYKTLFCLWQVLPTCLILHIKDYEAAKVPAVACINPSEKGEEWLVRGLLYVCTFCWDSSHDIKIIIIPTFLSFGKILQEPIVHCCFVPTTFFRWNDPVNHFLGR